MRVLVCCDDTYHPAATVRAGLAPLVSAGGFEFHWIEDATGWEPARLRDYPVVLLSKSNVCSATNPTPWLAGPTAEVLGEYVRAGGGLVAVHSGTASYKEWPAVRAVLGGVFVSHPPPCAVEVDPIGGHPLCAGVDRAFTVHDEHYQMVVDDRGADVFLRTRSVHGVQPAGWVRREGQGLVVVLTPGHFAEVWLHPSMQQLLTNALNAVVDATGRDRFPTQRRIQAAGRGPAAGVARGEVARCEIAGGRDVAAGREVGTIRREGVFLLPALRRLPVWY